MSLLPGPLTFSDHQLKAILRDERLKPPRSIYEQFRGVNHHAPQAVPGPVAAREMCLELYSSINEPEGHLDHLDSSFGSMYDPKFVKSELDEDRVCQFNLRENPLVVARATSLLSRLPATAPDILEVFEVDREFLVPYMTPALMTQSNTPDARNVCWTELHVSHFVDCTVLRLAIFLAVLYLGKPFGGPGMTAAVLNAKIELLNTSLQISSEQGHTDPKWLIVCAFLWTSWQRFLLLHLWFHMDNNRGGFSYEAYGSNRLRGLRTIPVLLHLRKKQQLEELRMTPYLCGWAYRTLQNDRACLGMDLRRFHEVYHGIFGKRQAMCNSGLMQCDGSSSYACRRFKDTVVTNQSVHSSACDGRCNKLFWDRCSFVNVSGPKAVQISGTGGSTIKYCEATEKTLTVSHVWSHGQGGRPDQLGPEGTGFNACLHRRYAKLATSFGYHSYWMDTACIPSEPKLRWECIANITSIFARSETTVVCDHDLMIIDVSNVTIEVCERILAILLVCDWNMRAWTLLEAIRGRHGLYLLCQNANTISLLEVLETVQNSGRIDLLVLFLSRAYLFPPGSAHVDLNLFDDSGESHALESEEDREQAQGLVSIGEAAALLSHRHPTRDGDDLLIWSLLIGDVEDQRPEEMWKRQVGRSINTGCLLSSAPRLKCPGFGWAPSSPTTRRQTETLTAERRTYLAFDGEGTMRGRITADGLCTFWLTYKFSSSVPNEERPGFDGQHEDSDFQQRMRDVAERYVQNYAWGVLLKVCPCKGPKNVPIQYRDCDGQLLVVCGSHDGVRWEWRDVYEWRAGVFLPRFKLEKVLLI